VSGIAGFVHQADLTWDAGKVTLWLLYWDEKEASDNISSGLQEVAFFWMRQEP
jgi:hypothetical protein